jgi:hypothetical protein
MALKNNGVYKRLYFIPIGILFIISMILFISFHCFSNNPIAQIYKDSLKIHRSFILPDKIIETSGLYYSDSLVWTFNDSGGEPELYAFSMSKNEIVKQVTIAGAYNMDWETITSDKSFLYIGDIGNNFGTRDTFCIYKVDKKAIAKKAVSTVNASKILFTYPGYQPVSLITFTKSAFDCEAMVCWNDSIFLFTKDWVSKTSTIYRIPNKPGYHKAKKLFTINSNGLITDACYNRKYVLLLGYKDFQPFLLVSSSPNKTIVDTTHLKRIELASLKNAQTEGIAFLNDSTILVTSEKSESFNASLQIIRL